MEPPSKNVNCSQPITRVRRLELWVKAQLAKQAYRSERLGRLRRLLRVHPEQEDGEVVHGCAEPAGHEGHGLVGGMERSTVIRLSRTRMCMGLEMRTVPTRTSFEGSRA